MVMPSSFSAHIGPVGDDGVAVLAVEGDVDVLTSPRLQRECAALLERPGLRGVVLDLTACGFLDSTGIRTCLGLDDELQRRGGALALAVTAAPILRSLSLTGIDRRLAVLPDVDAARGRLAARPAV